MMREMAMADEIDGRRRRSGRNRQRIIDAYLDLIRAGDMAPSAARVAERAGVGLRSVFRHFDDMESLYGQMAEQIMAEVRPLLDRPYAAADWRGRLQEAIVRRAQVFEHIFCIKLAGSLNRYHSDVLMRRYRQDVKMERAALKRVLPEPVVADAELFAALEVTLGFGTWQRLREDQELSEAAAKSVLSRMVSGLVSDEKT